MGEARAQMERRIKELEEEAARLEAEEAARLQAVPLPTPARQPEASLGAADNSLQPSHPAAAATITTTSQLGTAATSPRPGHPSAVDFFGQQSANPAAVPPIATSTPLDQAREESAQNTNGALQVPHSEGTYPARGRPERAGG